MKRIISVLAAVMLVMTLASCDKDVPPVTKTSNPKTLETMTLEEKVGQLLFVRCPDPQSVDKMMEINPAGILMFGRDFDGLTRDEVIDKIKDFQSKSNIPLIIGVDEEGGTVVRVSANPNLAPEKYKSPQEIFREGGMEALIANATEKSELLLSLGINMNLAPVADLPQTESDFIYDRSMGTDVNITADGVKNIVLAMRTAGIASCLKHFPGYGNNVDTHTGIAVDNRDIESFSQRVTDEVTGEQSGGDFVPFQAGIAAGADAVLVSHNIVTCMDADLPASLSPAVHEILRDELGFNGVIMTDDIAMGAVSDVEDVYIKAVNAGNDLLITTDYDTAYNEILSAVKNGEISMETINRAVEHILKLKGLI